MASRDKVDVDMFHKSIQYALEKLGKSKSGFERTVVSKFKRKRRVGSGNELVDYSRATCLGADQKARGLWERDWITSIRLFAIVISKWTLPELSVSDRWSRGTKFWERDWFTDSNVKFTDSEVRTASRFASSTQQEIEKLLEDKDSIILSLEMHLTFLHLIVL